MGTARFIACTCVLSQRRIGNPLKKRTFKAHKFFKYFKFQNRSEGEWGYGMYECFVSAIGLSIIQPCKIFGTEKRHQIPRDDGIPVLPCPPPPPQVVSAHMPPARSISIAGPFSRASTFDPWRGTRCSSDTRNGTSVGRGFQSWYFLLSSLPRPGRGPTLIQQLERLVVS
ncbi:hypothetical protein BC832DRAFT_202608 [Gaertneriomyces semiglobifer]|nr:hypothetical protein BC832DRAFT_202608 [Gaertneriomyces semiglobifer]